MTRTISDDTYNFLWLLDVGNVFGTPFMMLWHTEISLGNCMSETAPCDMFVV